MKPQRKRKARRHKVYLMFTFEELAARYRLPVAGIRALARDGYFGKRIVRNPGNPRGLCILEPPVEAGGA